jgi:hypothetical protein
MVFMASKNVLKLAFLNPTRTMNFKNSLCFVFFFALLLVTVSCKQADQKGGTDDFPTDPGLKGGIEDLIYELPSPTEIPYVIQQSGAEFNESLLNPRSKTDKYIPRVDKAAMNLGVYTADIGYLVSYDKTQEAIDYLNSCKTLADNLGVLGSFDIELLKRFESNISNKDSLSIMLNQTIQQTEKLLRDDARSKLAVLVLTGSFIEGLYISTGLVNSYPKDLLPADTRNVILTPVIQVILNQQKSVSNLLKMLTSVEQTEPVTSIVADVIELEKAYNALDIEDQIASNRADLMLSDKNLVQITEIVGRIRTLITE